MDCRVKPGNGGSASDSLFNLRDHPHDDRLQLRQVDSRSFPQNLIVDAMIFMPQRIADGDDVGPWRIGIARPQVFGQGTRGLGNDLDRAFGNPTKGVSLLVNF
jgi:hypothetical protein